MADAQSNRVVQAPPRDPFTSPPVPAPIGEKSRFRSIADGIVDMISAGAHIVTGAAAALPEPVLEHLVHKLTRGTPATNAPQLRASTPEEAALASAPPTPAAAASPLAGMLPLAVGAFLLWRLLR